MYFEFQLSANVFTRIIRNRFKALPLCIDREIIGENNNPLVVDQVVIGDSTWIQREQGNATQIVWFFTPTGFYSNFTAPFLQVRQEVRIHLVRSSDLDANGPNPSTPFRILTLYPVYNVALKADNQTQGGGPLTLSYTLAYVDFGDLLDLPEPLRIEIQQFIAGVQLPSTTVDLKPLSELLKRPVDAINAGIACDSAGTFVALRTDFDLIASSTFSLSKDFFEAGPVNLLAGKEWALLTDANLLIQHATQEAKSALETAAKINIISGPNASWDPSDASLNVSGDVEAVDACSFFIDDIDLDVAFNVHTTFSVPTPNTLRKHSHLISRPSDVLEVITCAVTGALVWPFLGTALLATDKISLIPYLVGLVEPIAAYLSLLNFIRKEAQSQAVLPSCVKQDDENYECDEVLDLRMGLTPGILSRLELESAYGVLEGLVLAGTISNLSDFFTGNIESIDVDPFSWQIVGHCTGNGTNNFRIANQAAIGVSGTPPAGMCSARILGDPVKEFTLMTEDGSVTIVPSFKPEYVANPYPCRVRLVTNRGVRTLTLLPPTARTDSESHTLESALTTSIASCYAFEREFFTPVEKIGWLIDPPTDGQHFVQFWQIAMRDMQPQDILRVVGGEGMTVMTARPSGTGVAHLSLMFPGDQALSELTMELQGQWEANDKGREMSVRQILFEHRTSLPVRGPLRIMRFEGDSRGQHLVIVGGDQEMTWNVTEPVAPSLLRSIAYKKSDERDDVSGGDIVIHTGKRVGAMPTPNLRRAMDGMRDRVGSLEALGAPRVAGISETLYVRTKGAITLFDISQPEEPREIQVYNKPAWYEGTAFGGTLMAKYNPDLNVVELYAVTKSKAL